MESLLNHPIDEMSDNARVPVTTISQTAAGLSIASAILFLILLTSLHVLKHEVDPSWQMISEYEIRWFNKSGMKTVFAKMTVYDEKIRR